MNRHLTISEIVKETGLPKTTVRLWVEGRRFGNVTDLSQCEDSARVRELLRPGSRPTVRYLIPRADVDAMLEARRLGWPQGLHYDTETGGSFRVGKKPGPETKYWAEYRGFKMERTGTARYPWVSALPGGRKGRFRSRKAAREYIDVLLDGENVAE